MMTIYFTEEETLWGESCTHSGCSNSMMSSLRKALTGWFPKDVTDLEVECAEWENGELFLCLSGTRCPDFDTLRGEWGFPRDFEGCDCSCGQYDSSKDLPLVNYLRAMRIPCTKSSAIRLLECLGAQRSANYVAGRFQ